MTGPLSLLLVCTRCRMPGSDPSAPRPGAALLAAAQALAPPDGPTGVQGIECLSGCNRPCVVALLAPARVTYVFGDLRADSMSAAELLQAARDHAAAPDGWLPRAARPERLRAGILARVPPLHWPSTAGGPVAWPA